MTSSLARKQLSDKEWQYAEALKYCVLHSFVNLPRSYLAGKVPAGLRDHLGDKASLRTEYAQMIAL